MNNHKGEPSKITGEIPVSLNLLSVVNDLSIHYMKVKGLFYLGIGLTWIFFQSPSREAGLAWVDILTPAIVGGLWILAGLISMWSGFFGSRKAKRLGFFALIAVPMLLGAYFFISWLMYFIPSIDSEGYQRGAITTISYWAYSASAYIMARVYTHSSGGLRSDNKGGR